MSEVLTKKPIINEEKVKQMLFDALTNNQKLILSNYNGGLPNKTIRSNIDDLDIEIKIIPVIRYQSLDGGKELTSALGHL